MNSCDWKTGFCQKKKVLNLLTHLKMRCFTLVCEDFVFTNDQFFHFPICRFPQKFLFQFDKNCQLPILFDGKTEKPIFYRASYNFIITYLHLEIHFFNLLLKVPKTDS